MLQRYAFGQAGIGFDHDEDGRDGDHCAFEHGGQEFGLVVTERMIGIWRHGAYPDRAVGGNRCHDIDDAF